MRKLLMSLAISLCCAGVASAYSQRFKAACLNVDGMPPSAKILGGVSINLNPDGAREDGSRRIGELVAQKGWDFVGLSEDFNYHSELMEYLTPYYYDGTHRGKINTNNALDGGVMHNGKLKLNTDGLGMLWKKSLVCTDESWTPWDKTHGYTDSGSDELIKKGFRYYMVRVGSGLEIDVYVHHMDAETNPEDNEARESQINQLVDVILASQNHRPIIIMGDTNCRYTRDNLRDLLFGRINADPRFEIHDPWIDFMYDGVMPELGSPSLMVGALGQQKGEVVDKIFYINNTDANGVKLTANSFLHDTDFSYADGTPISDHYPIVIDFTIENAASLPVGVEYFMRNVKTGTYAQAGGSWDTQGMLSPTGGRFKFDKGESDTDFIITSTLKKGDCAGYLKPGPSVYLDGEEDDTASQKHWTVTRLENDNYTIINPSTGEAMAASADGMSLTIATANAADASQQWQLVTIEDLKNELLKNASVANPMDATFFIRGYRFGRNDSDNDYWEQVTKDRGLTTFGVTDNSAEATISMFAIGGRQWSANTAGEARQTVSDLPNGLYKIEFDMASSTGNGYVKINNIEKTAVDGGIGATASVADAQTYFNNGNGHFTVDFECTTGDVEILIGKKHNGSKQMTYFDNFKLTYYGLSQAEVDIYDKVKRAIDDAQAKADELGLRFYDNRTVVERYENRVIVGDGDKEVRETYDALANASKKQTNNPADLRYVVLNNCFEMGSTIYWDTTNAQNARVEDASGVAGAHLQCILRADGGSVAQTVQLSAGVYEISAMLSPGATLSVVGQSIEAPNNGTSDLVKVTLQLILNESEITIALGSNSAFAADDLRITRKGGEENALAYDMLRAAINDANYRIENLAMEHPELSDNWSLQDISDAVENMEIVGDGTKEFNEIYNRLRQRVIRQDWANADYTSAIINPSFEVGRGWGEPWGWEYYNIGDTKVAYTPHETYGVEGADGYWLYNTWDDDAAYPIHQIVTGLPAGRYKLSCIVASDNGKTIFLSVNGQREKVQIASDKTKATPISIEFDLASDEDLYIEVNGGDADGNYVSERGTWYKCDDFRLILLGKTEESIDVTFEHEVNTLILPFGHEVPEGIRVFEAPRIIDSSRQGVNYQIVCMEQVDYIKAHTPYLVKINEEIVAKAPKRRINFDDSNVEEQPEVYTFTGQPEGDLEAHYTHGVLTGVHKEVQASPEHYVLAHDADAPYFKLVGEGNAATVEAHRAYIATSAPYSSLRFSDEGVVTGVENVSTDLTSNQIVDVYTPAGLKVATNIEISMLNNILSPGIYIVRTPTTTFKLAF